jgi:predicted RNA-binding Zn-ribbon protein involved in translation (DUF1610 family)
MKCLACGREMDNKGTHFECPNSLCDYEEEIENDEARIPAFLKICHSSNDSGDQTMKEVIQCC